MNVKLIVIMCIAIVAVIGGGAAAAVILVSNQAPVIKEQSIVNTEAEVKKVALNGWKEEKGNWYFYKDDEKQKNWIQDKDQWYYLGSDGKMRTGWIKDSDEWYYLNEDGTMATNVTIDGCYLNNDGIIEEIDRNKEQDKNKEVSTDIEYTTYTNSRYGFSIKYPVDFIPMAPPANGDGRGFMRNDGKVVISGSGHNNALFWTIQQYYDEAISSINGNISYKVLNNNNYAISWEENGMIYYEYSILGKDSMNTFRVKYPKEEQEKYNKMVDEIYRTFYTPGIDEAH